MLRRVAAAATNTAGRRTAGGMNTKTESVAAGTAAVAAARPLTILRLVDLERTAIKVHAVEGLHRASSVGLGHFDKSNAARPPGIAIADQRHLFHRSVLRKQLTNSLFRCRERKISDK
jgi:hypothetical protein